MPPGDDQGDPEGRVGRVQVASPAELAKVLVVWARSVPLAEYIKSPRGPKNPKPKKPSGAKIKHVSTARVLEKIK